jgi:5-methylcytosine-specific restriction protein A
VTLRVCPVKGCPALTEGGRCAEHLAAADKARGTSKERGYATPGHRRFRRLVLRADPTCVLCHLDRSTVADHYPLTRRELVLGGLNPDDPQHGRGLCATCHNRHTAATSPGGWHHRT